jgi:hypothetical protein
MAMKTRRMTLIGLAIAITLLAAPALNAQQTFNSELGNGRWSAVEPPLSAAYTESGYFNPEIGNVPQSEPFAMWNGLGEVASADENFIEVSEIIEDDYVPEGQSVYVLVTHKVPVHPATQEIALRGK